jgi:hypothetical protein
MIQFRKFGVLAAMAAAVAVAAPVEAAARGWHHHHHHHYRGGGGGAWIPFAVVGGLAAGALIASSANSRDRYYGPRHSYYAPPRAYHRPCHVVHRVEDVDGYAVKMAATMCYDSNGVAYIVQGSQHPVDDSWDY